MKETKLKTNKLSGK